MTRRPAFTKLPELAPQEDLDAQAALDRAFEEAVQAELNAAADFLDQSANECPSALVKGANLLRHEARDIRKGLHCLEFSDHGRSDRFPSGWWIAPAALLSFGLAGLLAWVWMFS